MFQQEFFKKELVKELRLVEVLMKREENIEKKIYYFSAAYGITSRTYRYAFSDDDLLADLVLTSGYQGLSDRLQSVKSGDITVKLDETPFKKIEERLRKLADAFENSESILEPLKAFLTATFSTSGTLRDAPHFSEAEYGVVTL